DLGTDGSFSNAADEVLDHLEVDVGLEEAEPDLAHRGVDVGFTDAAAAGEVGERLAQPFAEIVEHGSGGTPEWMWTERGVVTAATLGWCTSSGAPRRAECSAWDPRVHSLGLTRRVSQTRRHYTWPGAICDPVVHAQSVSDSRTVSALRSQAKSAATNAWGS